VVNDKSSGQFTPCELVVEFDFPRAWLYTVLSTNQREDERLEIWQEWNFEKLVNTDVRAHNLIGLFAHL